MNANNTIPEVEQFVVKENEQKVEKKRRDFKQYIGIFLGLISAFFLSIANIFARKAELFSGSEITVFSNITLLIPMLAVVCWKKENPLGPKKHRCVLFIRGIVHSLGVLSMKISVKLISPSDATALLHTNAIIVALMSRFIFKEMFSFIHILCLFMAITGKLLNIK